MSLMSALCGGVVGGIISIFTGYLFMGALFHRFQARTPSTWRSEGPKQYAFSSAFILLSSIGLSLLFALTGGVTAAHGSSWWLQGLAFGSLCWAALPLPSLLSTALFVNLHRGFVVGALLDSFVACMLTSVAVAWFIVR
jgi:hypothetical protein